MISIKRILTATDFSDASAVALKYAVALANAFQAEVILCHVLEQPDLLAGLPPVSEGYIPPNLAELQEQNARVQCEEILAAAGLSKSRLVLRHGHPAHLKAMRLAQAHRLIGILRHTGAYEGIVVFGSALLDGVIDEDRLGIDSIYVQAKRWESTVGRPEIQKFAGALQGQRATKGIFITTSDFSREAKDFAQQIGVRIVLINGRRLAELMFEFDVGVSSKQTFVVKQIDGDYFEES